VTAPRARSVTDRPGTGPAGTLTAVGADAIGLVLARPARMLGFEPFFMELIGGIEETLSSDDRSLLLHVVPDHHAEIAAYRRWGQGDLVDAVVLVDLVVDDPRLAVLGELGIPTVVVGGPERSLPGVAHVWIDNAQAMRDAVAYLVGLGHRTVGRVSGPAALAHTRSRTEAFLDECARRGARGAVVEADYGQESGTRATRALLGRNDPPSAVVYDNDVMAVAGLGVANELGLGVPSDVSLLAAVRDEPRRARHGRPGRGRRARPPGVGAADHVDRSPAAPRRARQHGTARACGERRSDARVTTRPLTTCGDASGVVG